MAQKIFLLIGIIVAIAILSVSHYTGYLEKSLIGAAINEFAEADWGEIHERYIVENSVPVTILEDNAGRCLLEAKFFERIIDHVYFKRANELAEKLNYDRENETIAVDCSELNTELDSKIVVWYVTEDSPIDPKKYSYWFEEVSEENLIKP